MANTDNTTTRTDDDGQPIGTTSGGLAGAATGAAMGMAGGPVGAVIGGVAGAVVGGLTGKGVEKVAQNATLDPAAHDAYWQENHGKQTYASGTGYEGYRNAYRTGYEGAATHGVETRYEDIEPRLASEYASRRDATSVDFEKARPAVRAAFDRAAEEIRLVLHEERLTVGKREVEGGAVHIRKTVTTEDVNVPIELRREEIHIERIGADQIREGVAADAFQERTIDVSATREEAVVSKDTVVTGAVRVSKTAETETQNVSDSVRKEDVEVERGTTTTTTTANTVVDRTDDADRR